MNREELKNLIVGVVGMGIIAAILFLPLEILGTDDAASLFRADLYSDHHHYYYHYYYLPVVLKNYR